MDGGRSVDGVVPDEKEGGTRQEAGMVYDWMGWVCSING